MATGHGQPGTDAPEISCYWLRWVGWLLFCLRRERSGSGAGSNTLRLRWAQVRGWSGFVRPGCPVCHRPGTSRADHRQGRQLWSVVWRLRGSRVWAGTFRGPVGGPGLRVASGGPAPVSVVVGFRLAFRGLPPEALVAALPTICSPAGGSMADGATRRSPLWVLAHKGQKTRRWTGRRAVQDPCVSGGPFPARERATRDARILSPASALINWVFCARNIAIRGARVRERFGWAARACVWIIDVDRMAVKAHSPTAILSTSMIHRPCRTGSPWMEGGGRPAGTAWALPAPGPFRHQGAIGARCRQRQGAIGAKVRSAPGAVSAKVRSAPRCDRRQGAIGAKVRSAPRCDRRQGRRGCGGKPPHLRRRASRG